MRKIATITMLLVFLLVAGCNETRTATTAGPVGEKETKYGTLPEWFGSISGKVSGGSCICLDASIPNCCSAEPDPVGLACGATTIAVVGVDGIRQFQANDPSDIVYHEGNTANNPTTGDHTHVMVKVEKLLMGVPADFDGKTLWQSGTYDISTGQLSSSCGMNCMGPVWPGERGIAFVTTLPTGPKDVYLLVMLPFKTESVVTGKPDGGGTEYDFGNLTSMMKNGVASSCPAKASLWK